MPVFVLLALLLLANWFFAEILVFTSLNILDFLRGSIFNITILLFLLLLVWCFDD
jgi:hypothetical protein